MRVIQTYTFKIGSKTPYSDYPTIARRFLESQNLTAKRFLYYFDEMLYQKSYEETLATGSCAKARKDCPALGDIRFLDAGEYGSFCHLFMSNIDIDTGCTETDILPHMKKIHRRYGFRESDLYYYDINFFGEVIPFERDMTQVESQAVHFECEVDPAFLLHNQPYGSGIRLHRYVTGGNYISLSIDLLHNGQIHDATPYFNAMKVLLPSIHPYVDMKIFLTPEEKQQIAQWDRKIAPVVENACSYFTERFPGKERQNSFLSQYTLAAQLKKLAKRNGFCYHYEGFGVYVLDKRTPRGHVLRLWVDSGPSHSDTTYHVNIQGIGFCHALCRSRQTPTNQAESNVCSEKIFSLVSEFEKIHIPELDRFYEETPSWFVPSALW